MVNWRRKYTRGIQNKGLDLGSLTFEISLWPETSRMSVASEALPPWASVEFALWMYGKDDSHIIIPVFVDDMTIAAKSV